MDLVTISGMQLKVEKLNSWYVISSRVVGRSLFAVGYLAVISYLFTAGISLVCHKISLHWQRNERKKHLVAVSTGRNEDGGCPLLCALQCNIQSDDGKVRTLAPTPDTYL
jgi:hypothetical protein